MRYGVDVDGVLAEFNSAYIDRILHVTGRDLFPPRPFITEQWSYPEHYGYTDHELANVWQDIKQDRYFWSRLPTFPETHAALVYLDRLMDEGHEVYFITARPGLDAKSQTESWLELHWPTQYTPTLTVLISARKDLCAEALDLDCYIDDRDINVESVARVRNLVGGIFHERTRTFLLTRPWNRDCDPWPLGIHRVGSVGEMEG